MPAPSPLGWEAKLYYMVGGQAGGGSWVELTNARDVTVTPADDEVEVTTRRSAGTKEFVQGLRDITIEGEMINDSTDPGFVAFKNAWLNRQVIGIRALDVANGQGPQFDAIIPTFSRGEPLGDVQTISFTIRPTRSTVVQSWYVGA